MKRAPVLVAVAVIASCTRYDFEPVEPVAVSMVTYSEKVEAVGLKPNVMLLLDTSGSMNFGTPTRMDQVRAAMGTFLAQQGAVARFGLTTYPASGADVCAPATGAALDIVQSNDVPADLSAAAGQISAAINALQPAGGTPTGASLRALGQLASLRDPARRDFVLLLTDGLPNCNASNPNTCGNPAACRCTSAGGCVATTCSTGCLDDQGAIAAVQALNQGSPADAIQTIVIGFGADVTNPDGVATLDAMARAGGFQRTCAVDADCGAGDACAAGLCGRQFFQAADGAQLGALLAAIIQRIGKDPCLYPLAEAPSAANLVTVLVDGQPVGTASDTWFYDAATNQVQFQGSLCTRARQSSAAAPLDVEIRLLRSL